MRGRLVGAPASPPDRDACPYPDRTRSVTSSLFAESPSIMAAAKAGIVGIPAKEGVQRDVAVKLPAGLRSGRAWMRTPRALARAE